MNTHTLHTHTPRRTHAHVHSPHVCAHTSTHPPRNTNQTHSHVTLHGNASNARIITTSQRPRSAPNHVRSDHEDQTQTRTPITSTSHTRAPYIHHAHAHTLSTVCQHYESNTFTHHSRTRCNTVQHAASHRSHQHLAWLHGLAHVASTYHTRAHTRSRTHSAQAHTHTHTHAAPRDHGPHQIMSDQTTRIRHRRAHQLQAHHIHARRTFTTRMHTHSVQSASITNQIHSRIIHARVATQYNTPPAIAAISIWLGSTGLLTWPARTTLARTHARARAARKRTRTRTRMLRRAPRCNILPGAPTPLPRCCTSTATRNNSYS